MYLMLNFQCSLLKYVILNDDNNLENIFSQQPFERHQHRHVIPHLVVRMHNAEKETERVLAIASMDTKVILTTKSEAAEESANQAVIVLTSLHVLETNVSILVLAHVELMQFVKFERTYHAAHVQQGTLVIHSHTVAKNQEHLHHRYIHVNLLHVDLIHSVEK
jgi:hypothetical protein